MKSAVSMVRAALLVAQGVLACATAFGRTIDFDADAAGATVVAPLFFADASPLADAYAVIGVHFAGPGPGLGGAILDELGNFGVPARSGHNVLAFNVEASYAVGPETVTFDVPIDSVSVYVASGFDGGSFRLLAYDAAGQALASAAVATGPGAYALLSVSAPGTRGVVITADDPDHSFVLDDLAFAAAVVPEPAPRLLWAAGLALLALLTLLKGAPEMISRRGSRAPTSARRAGSRM